MDDTGETEGCVSVERANMSRKEENRVLALSFMWLRSWEIMREAGLKLKSVDGLLFLISALRWYTFWSQDQGPSPLYPTHFFFFITYILHKGSRRSLKVCWMNVELITIVSKSVQTSFHNNCLHGKILSSVWGLLYHFSSHDNCYLFMHFFLMKIKASWGQRQCYL